ncbi:MAG: hypothetical protein WCB05_23135 [Candidatus Sulfotelmatobacter sp.]|jgi:hypothetical protein
MDPFLAELKATVEAIADPEDRETSRALTILVSSLDVGADVERLSQHTGFSKEVVQQIADHMIEAGLWVGELVDDTEWWDEDGELDGVVLFAHAQVALGSILRKSLPDCILYIDRETGAEILKRSRTLQ